MDSDNKLFSKKLYEKDKKGKWKKLTRATFGEGSVKHFGTTYPSKFVMYNDYTTTTTEGGFNIGRDAKGEILFCNRSLFQNP